LVFFVSYELQFIFQRKTVYLWKQRWSEEGDITKHVSFGRPKKTTLQQDQQLIEDVRYRRFVNTSTYAAQLNVSSHTIRRRLHDAGLHHRVPAKKPLLTDRHKTMRFNFAQRYLDYDFNGVLFLDEKVFTSATDGRLSLWRVNHSRYSDANVLPNRRSGRISVGYWGWMGASGPGELVEISGRLNSLAYKDILEQVLVPTANLVYGHRPIHFVQDNSSIHNAGIVQSWIENQTDLHLIRMPPKSPDINPIENLWGLMVQSWDSSMVRTTQNLKDHVLDVWDSFRGTEVCSKMVGSMRSRLQAVIDADGDYTRY
jgi:transposase